ncbi:hypothetical protein [Kitasatospora sp. NPDC058046]
MKKSSHNPTDKGHRAARCPLCAPLRHPSRQDARAGLAVALPRQIRKGGQ